MKPTPKADKEDAGLVRLVYSVKLQSLHHFTNVIQNDMVSMDVFNIDSTMS